MKTKNITTGRGRICIAIMMATLALVAMNGTFARAESYGINFLGNTTDLVTNNAGVVPIMNWNNIASTFTSGTIQSSDGSQSPVLTISGAWPGDGGWNTGSTSDGGDWSLNNGYADTGANIANAGSTVHALTNTISGLTGSSYTLYLYVYSGGNSMPVNGGCYLPSYSVNGVSYYAPTLGYWTSTYNNSGTSVGGPFTGFVPAKVYLANFNTATANAEDFGNYLEIDNVTPVGGVVTVVAEADSQSWRSPLAGFELVLNTSAVAPHITTQTASFTNYAGSTAQLTVVSSGSPLNYQWKAGAIGSGTYTNLVNAGNISGATSSTLTISNITAANVADYIVVITNTAGSATSVAPTTVNVKTMFLSGPSPSSSVLYPGGSVQFAVNVTATAPLTYVWRKNGTILSDGAHISGSGTSVLTVANASAADVGSYDVVVSNLYGVVTSSPASLDITAAPGAGTYAQAVMAQGPMAYWRFNETSGTIANDYAGGHTGNYGANSLQGQPAPASPAFPGFDSDNVCLGLYPGFLDSAMVVPADSSPSLNTNTVTFTGWIYAYTLPANAGLVFERGPAGDGGFVIGGNGDLGYEWNGDSATWSWDSGFHVPLQEWTFVALVLSPTNATVYMYNAEGMRSAVFTHNHANGPGRQALWIGADPIWADGSRVFDGSIDEVALFNRALSNEEITQLYTIAAATVVAPAIAIEPADEAIVAGASAQFSVTATGSEPLSYQWKFNGADVVNAGTASGANTATLNLANVTTANSGGYSVVVANSAGSVTSSVATLTVIVATNYDKGVLGLNPLGYWRLNETSGTTAIDSSSQGLNGTYGDQVTLGAAGVPNASFYGLELNNYAAVFNGVSNSCVSLPSLNLNSNVATFTLWIKPATLSTTPNTGLIFCRDTAGTTAGFGLNPGGELGYTWNGEAATYGWHTGLVPPTNQWSFVALVVTSTNATIYMYNANGKSVAALAHDNPVQAFSGETKIGSDVLYYSNWDFNGAIDEAAVFNSALTFAQISGMYINAVRGSTGAPAPRDTSISIAKLGGSIQLQWVGMLLEATNVTGPWMTNSSVISPLIVTPSESRKFYRVLPHTKSQ